MKQKMGYEWKLREVMARHEMWKTTDLAPRLAERGILLSPPQVYRLVTAKPERLSLPVLAALCDIFECDATEFFTTFVADTSQRRAVNDEMGSWSTNRPRRPPRAEIRPSE